MSRRGTPSFDKRLKGDFNSLFGLACRGCDGTGKVLCKREHAWFKNCRACGGSFQANYIDHRACDGTGMKRRH